MIQIKIPDPEENKILFRTEEIDNSSFLCQFQIFISRNNPVTVITNLIHSETLPRSADLTQIKIVHFYCKHPISPSYISVFYPLSLAEYMNVLYTILGINVNQNHKNIIPFTIQKNITFRYDRK